MPPSPSLLHRYYGELKKLLLLSLPIMGAQLSAIGMGFVDVTMAGHYSSTDLAAVAIGGSIWFPLFNLIRGVLMAMTPIVAQLYGAKEYDRIGHKAFQGVWIAVILSLVSLLLLWGANPLMEWMEVDAAIAPIARAYIGGMAYGAPAMCMYQVMTSYCEGVADTKAPMLVGFAGLLVNIPANYVLIYGKLGLPALGGAGCGYATAICFTLMAVLMLIYTRCHPDHQKTSPLKSVEKPKLSSIAEHLRLGLPVGISFFIETSIFAVIALAIGSLGATVVAGHQIALNISNVTYVIPVSLGAGVTIRIGYEIGAGNPKDAFFASMSGVVTILILASFLVLGILTFAPELASIYTTEVAVIALAAELLIFAAMFQLVDGVQILSIGALRGYKDTRVPMYMMMFACWVIAMPLGYILALTDILVPTMGPHGFWIGLVTALSIVGILSFNRLRIIGKRHVRNSERTAQHGNDDHPEHAIAA
ncbi:MATE family efflux transporter [Sansalvadorimonas sp. 2012CJ34-2]|uniref:Multidrug-efflux transporter n=1 Tax=Parendozoicomonas callyspongiae TaxID=2942213 RepID=A0ABT0PKU6_9GAMM|nr:MATE family efflux transporter [Sansalvadorimonas sp. 2012CJ34-2]MCL6272015.1 MATE family efflux transporter [Sansalvadorimonas sp. 2012CJ34-2]